MELVEELGVLVVGKPHRYRLYLNDALHVICDQMRLDGAGMPEHSVGQVAKQRNSKSNKDQQD